MVTTSEGTHKVNFEGRSLDLPSQHHRSQVTEFLYDELKDALYLEYAHTVVVRWDLAKDSAVPETVFSVKNTCSKLISGF